MGPYIEAGGDEIIECQGREVLIPRGLVIDRVERLAVDIRVALCSEIDPEPQLLNTPWSGNVGWGNPPEG